MKKKHEIMKMRDIAEWGDNDVLDIITIEDDAGRPIFVKYKYEEDVIQTFYPSGRLKTLEVHSSSYDSLIEYNEDGNILKSN